MLLMYRIKVTAKKKSLNKYGDGFESLVQSIVDLLMLSSSCPNKIPFLYICCDVNNEFW